MPKPADLLVWCDVEEDLYQADTIRNQRALEVVDLAVRSFPFVRRSQPLHPFDQHSAIPGAIEHHNFALLRQFFPKPL